MGNMQEVAYVDGDSDDQAKAISTALDKYGFITTIAKTSDLNRDQVKDVFAAMEDLIVRHLTPDSCREFTLPGILKIRLVDRPAKGPRSIKERGAEKIKVIPPKDEFTDLKITLLKAFKDKVLKN